MTIESTITIRELGGEERTLTLRGPTLPFQGVAFGSSQRLDTTWYPGNAAEATQHVLGPVEDSSDWSGAWSTVQMVRIPALLDPGGIRIGRANELRLLVEDMFRASQRLRIEWQNKGEVVVVREGRMRQFVPTFDRIDDIAWAVEWEWVSRGARQQKVQSRRSSSPETALGQLVFTAITVETLEEILNRRLPNLQDPFGGKLSLDDLGQLLDAPNQLVRDFARDALRIIDRARTVGDLIQQVRAIPLQLAGQALDVAASAVSVSNNFVDAMSRRAPETNVAQVKVSLLAKSVEYYGAATTQAELVGQGGVELRRQVQDSSRSRRTILAVHRVRQQEPLAAISRRYYGTSDHAPSIARSNALPLNQLVVEPGAILIIPTLDVVKNFNATGG